MEHLRKEIKVKCVNYSKDCKKWVSRPSFVFVDENFYEGKGDYTNDLQFYDPVDKKMISKMQYGVQGSIINELFVGLKSNFFKIKIFGRSYRN